MNRSPYSAYRGRKSALRRVLIAIVIVLVIALAVATVALFVLPNYVVYTPQGPQLVLPFFGSGQPSQTPEPTPGGPDASASAAATDPGVVVEPPSATPAPTASVAPDLSDLPRRDMTLGLVAAAGEGPREGDGSLFDMTGTVAEWNGDLNDERGNVRELNASFPYAAAWLGPDWGEAMKESGFADALTQRCLMLADSGYDEIIFSEIVPDGDGAELAQLYRAMKAALDDAGWQGRLGLVLDQGLFDAKYDSDLIPAVAQSFERLYFRTTLKSNHRTALTNAGFTANGYTLVTVVEHPANLNYAWVVLP